MHQYHHRDLNRRFRRSRSTSSDPNRPSTARFASPNSSSATLSSSPSSRPHSTRSHSHPPSSRPSNRPPRPHSSFPRRAKAPQFFNPEELCLSQHHSLSDSASNPQSNPISSAALGCASRPTISSSPASNTAAANSASLAPSLFSDFNLAPALAANLKKNNYATPTPIQDKTIPLIMAGCDVIGLANTGTGKTAAFLLPLIHKVFADRSHSQKVLIISPTRELAFQIRGEFEKFADRLNLRSILAIGGVNINHQLKQLAKPFDFVIGTPGRVLDLSQHHHLQLSLFQNIVLDEVDQMLDMGFIHDIKKIIAALAPRRQSLFFSATMNPAAEEVAHSFLTSPSLINVRVAETANNVHQSVIKLAGRTKREVLNDLLTSQPCQKTLIFARTKHGADKVVRNLSDAGFKAGAIHGNKAQNYRLKMLDLFQKDKINVLVATDVASRGLDIKNITHVINYDLPASREDYIHRIGRTGRADQQGVAISLVD